MLGVVRNIRDGALRRLVAAGFVTHEQALASEERARLHRGHWQDHLVQQDAITEASLIRFLAQHYRTRFVTSERLGRAVVDGRLLRRIPRGPAEAWCVCPVLFDAEEETLTVVAGDLENFDVARQVKEVTGVPHVRVYVSLPQAVIRLIGRQYRGVTTPSSLGETMFPDRPTPAVNLPAAVHIATMPPAMSSISSPAPSNITGMECVTVGDFLESIHVFVAMIEQQRGGLRGHSAQVARLCRSLAARVGLPEAHVHGIVAAAYLHDLGKGDSAHLTPFEVWSTPTLEERARRLFLAPVRMLESAHLSDVTVATLTHVYERVDGKGFPDGLAQRAIPVGARILALAETYGDLTHNAENSTGERLTPEAAHGAMRAMAGTVFDGDLLDLLRHIVKRDDMGQCLGASRGRVLVVDPDPEEASMLEMRLVERGLDVQVARDGDGALHHLAEQSFHMVVSEVDLGEVTGFELMQRAFMKPGGPENWVFLSSRGDGPSVDRGFELGAADYLVKPTSPELVAAKIRRLLHRASANVRQTDHNITAHGDVLSSLACE